ncbi:hypothetical protein GCM10007927_32850 [Sulfitobacter pacificus]|uniref:Uncharacterized protein n=1 Tax=Sulfitobacter pacificus TaxID=1499314 RepID=A0ABQ5VN42_9RHOB|nr:hypothetical protein GCM10007927_32850 [Sulfitobacter pacificus]
MTRGINDPSHPSICRCDDTLMRKDRAILEGNAIGHCFWQGNDCVAAKLNNLASQRRLAFPVHRDPIANPGN